MTGDRGAGLLAISAHARSVQAADRAIISERLHALDLPGTVLVETCHRVELHGTSEAIPPRLLADLPAGTDTHAGLPAAHHLIRLAVGRDSAVIGEDQVLHQVRVAARRARAGNDLPPELDRLIDVALRAGRTARSWLPGHRSDLAERAIQAVGVSESSGAVLVVGAGEMGRLAAIAVRHRKAELFIASRSHEHARALAARIPARTAAFDPGPADIAGLAGVVLALNGPWPIGAETSKALLASAAWVIDLSAPGALAPETAASLGARLTTIDDLARVAPSEPAYPVPLIARLDALIGQALADYADWAGHASQRAAADALARRAETVGAAELVRLMDRVTLNDEQREAVEQMVAQVTRRLLRDPLELLNHDRDGRHARAARELFRL